MKTLTLPTTIEGPFRYFTYTCGQHQAVNETMPWCCKCVVKYDVDVNRASVRLHPERKTERFAFAKALNATGGVRLGSDPKGPATR